MEKITSAAIKQKDLVWSGRRHSDIIHEIIKSEIDEPINSGDQGFLTSDNRFVDRAEAYQIAVAAGQIEDLKILKILYSEDLG